MDPYDILGLSYPCTKEDIKQRYRELAKLHHPDKLSHLSEEERKEHEEHFKKISVSYKLLMENDFSETSKTEWKGLWGYMDQWMKDPEMLRNMSDLLKKVVDVAKEYKKQKGSEHFIKCEVTLEEVHLQKEKKLRLFLHQIEEPVFILVNCGKYPTYLYTHITPQGKTLFIHLEFILKEHDVYYIDDVFSKNDLLAEIQLTLEEYMMGGERSLVYLDGSVFTVSFPRASLDVIVIENKGLFEQGVLRVVPRVILPTLEEISKVDLKDFEIFLKVCRKFKDSEQNDVKSI